MGADMISQLASKANSDEAFVRCGRFLSIALLLDVGAKSWLIGISEGKVVSVERGPFVMPSWSFALRAPEDEWLKFWSADSRPGFHDLMALIKRRTLKAEGNLQVFIANLRYFKEALGKLRKAKVIS